MKKYRVNVNGTSYEIEVEVLDSAAKAAAPAATAAPAPAPAPAAAAAPQGGTAVNSPMPGTIIDIKVANGAAVKAGEVLMILEAMKMENEIMAPCDGTVTVAATKGSTVEAGALLCTLA